MRRVALGTPPRASVNRVLANDANASEGVGARCAVARRAEAGMTIPEMDPEILLRPYEVTGDEDTFVQAKALYERALAASPDEPRAHLNYGYLLECHTRNVMRRATSARIACSQRRTWQLTATKMLSGSSTLGSS